MVICFHCSTETKEILDRLVQSGVYRDQDAAVEAAVLDLAKARAETLRNVSVAAHEKSHCDQSEPGINWEGIC